MRIAQSALVGSTLLLTACGYNQTIPNPALLSGTALKPPVSDLAVGTLFYTKEEQPDLKGLVSFYPLCTPDLSSRGFPPPKLQTSLTEIDLMPTVGGSINVSDINTDLVKLGLEADVSRYFEYKLTNIEVFSYDAVTAQNILANIDNWDRCKGWRKTVPGKPIFQIQQAYRGDLSFQRKNTSSMSADVSAKISTIEPKVKLALKSAFNYGVSGKGLFVVVDAVQRQ